MIFVEVPLSGAYLIEMEPNTDERGFFARSVCRDEFARHGLNAAFIQQSVSWNPLVGTLRGLHFQAPPHEEEKLVRVTQGGVFDVIVDIRKKSPSYGHWFGVELTAKNRRQLYVPKGFAHGFQTTQPDTEVFYQMSTIFNSASARGVRWNDPHLAIAWPHQVFERGDKRLSKDDSELSLWFAAEGAEFR
jgi:dTDP-4-dehydrorhamnose 3,5-epimerase